MNTTTYSNNVKQILIFDRVIEKLPEVYFYAQCIGYQSNLSTFVSMMIILTTVTVIGTLIDVYYTKHCMPIIINDDPTVI